jgi:hypothetical protein
MTYRELLEIIEKYPNPFSYHRYNRVYEEAIRESDNEQSSNEDTEMS